MKKRLFGALAVLGLTGLMIGALAVPAGAGSFDDTVLPSLTVTKTVTGSQFVYTIPNSALFTIQVNCTGKDDNLSAALVFNGDGTTHSAPGGWVDGGTSWTFQGWDLKHAACQITEQAGGATQYLSGSPSYACTFSDVAQAVDKATEQTEDDDTPPGCTSTNGVTPATVQFGSPWDHTCQLDEAAIAEGSGCLCIQSATVTVTNPIADDPAKVEAASAPAPVPVTPKFTG